MAGFRPNTVTAREPLGFIKLLEWLTAVFVFGSCGGYSGTSVISLSCSGAQNETLSVTFTFPFRLNHVLLVENSTTLCNRSVAETHLVGDSASSAQFFVAIGVLAFLYCVAAALLYLGYLHVYRDSTSAPKIDFLITMAFSALWLVSSSAWAKGLQNVKDATGTSAIMSTLALCREKGVTCAVAEFASMRSLNVSVIFGYLSMILWAGNAWFVYKETQWHTQKYCQEGMGSRPVPGST